MKKFAITFLALSITLVSVNNLYSASELSEEYQQDLFDRLNHLRGQGPVPVSLEGLDRPICGTSAAFDAFLNRDRLSSAYKTAAVLDGRDTSLSYAYASPNNHFLIHYDIVGIDAVYKPDLDTLDGGDGIPDYINKVGEIADSVWAFVVDDLGFPAPPSDDFYEQGLDARYDIYINSLGSAYYGATYSEAIVDAQSVTSVLVLDNDYNFFPYNQYSGDSRDLNRRLDAVRVTTAHEFFHAIHFGMDWTEWEGDDPGAARIYWWEMSAVWMEEMMYDDVNDYYGYLPAFYNMPWIGLRNFTTTVYPLAVHPYGSVVFPIYLTERWDDITIVRRIWEYCRDLGVGPQFGEAVNNAVFDVSGGTHLLVDAIREFSVWNVFTGNRADRAPAGIGYSEKEFYPAIPDSVFFEFDEYPIIMTNRDLLEQYRNYLPELYAANYINFKDTYLIPDSFNLYFYRPIAYSNMEWNISLVGIPLDDFDDAVVQMNEYQGSTTNLYTLTNNDELFNTYAVITPVTTDITIYDYRQTFDYGFAVLAEAIPPDSIAYYTFKTPYPNPCRSNPPCDAITFRVDKRPSDLNPPSLLTVMIFTIAGEKIQELTTDVIGNSYITLNWDMKNNGGHEVAGGVYLAYWRLSFPGGGEEITHKSKFAILK